MTRKHIVIEGRKCVGCQLCMRNCPVGKVIAFAEEAQMAYVKDPLACGGCGACLRGCPAGAIHVKEEWVEGAFDYTPVVAVAPGQARTDDEAGQVPRPEG